VQQVRTNLLLRELIRRLPEVLSPKEVERLLYANGKLRDRCLLMTA